MYKPSLSSPLELLFQLVICASLFGVHACLSCRQWLDKPKSNPVAVCSKLWEQFELHQALPFRAANVLPGPEPALCLLSTKLPSEQKYTPSSGPCTEAGRPFEAGFVRQAFCGRQPLHPHQCLLKSKVPSQGKHGVALACDTCRHTSQRSDQSSITHEIDQLSDSCS